jgi:hypothetical protein
MLCSKAVWCGVNLEEHLVLSDLLYKLGLSRDGNFQEAHKGIVSFGIQLLERLQGIHSYPSLPVKGILKGEEVPAFIPTAHAYFGWQTMLWKKSQQPWRIVFTNPIFPKSPPPKRWMGVGHRDTSQCRLRHELDPLDPVFARPEKETRPSMEEFLSREEAEFFFPNSHKAEENTTLREPL